MDTLLGEIPKPDTTELNEVSQDLLSANQYNGKPVQEVALKNYVPFILYHTSLGVTSQIIDKDIVITSLQCALSVTGNTKTIDASIALNGSTFFRGIVRTTATILSDSNNFSMIIPNWLLRAGDRLDSTFAITAGAGNDESIILTGYYL